MAIDTTVPESPGWWMHRLARELLAEQDRLNRLERYRRGEPQIVIGSQRLQSAYYRFQNMARDNFADLIVSARTARMSARAFRTSQSTDDTGDRAAWRMFTANGLIVGQTDLYRLMCTFGCAYMAAGAPVEPGGEPVITVEDPRQMITVQDPLRPWVSKVAFKIYHDSAAQIDYAILWLPGRRWVAQRGRKARQPGAVVQFSPTSFDMVPVGVQPGDGDGDGIVWADEQPDFVLDPDSFADDYDGLTSESYDLQQLPVVQVGNREGEGVFERHTDLLDRIAHVTLQAMVIATLQAFKQRAIELSNEAGEDGGLPDEDENGLPIDYDQVFEADPGALWRLPIGAKIWESGQVDMSGILGAGKDWILRLAACTQTPFPMFSPDSANQSANGASLYREGLTFDVEDLCRIAGAGLSMIIALGFALKGDTARADAADIIVDWAPAERFSIVDMAQADALSSLPRPQKYARIYGMSPADVQIAVAQAKAEAAEAIAAAQPISDPVVKDPAAA